MSEINDFKEEIKTYSADDILLILSDQKDLYSPEEIALLEEELSARNKSTDDFDREKYIGQTLENATNEDFDAAERYKAELMQKVENEQKRTEQEIISEKEELLKAEGIEGYWQYKVLSLIDEEGGFISPDILNVQLNELGLQGWRLVCAYSNELGHNSHSARMLVYSTGTNATIDQNILLFERYIKIK